MSVVLREPVTSSRECGHTDLERLGAEGNATFFRCLDCESVVIVEGAGRWGLRSARLP